LIANNRRQKPTQTHAKRRLTPPSRWRPKRRGRRARDGSGVQDASCQVADLVRRRPAQWTAIAAGITAALAAAARWRQTHTKPRSPVARAWGIRAARRAFRQADTGGLGLGCDEFSTRERSTLP
jgi:hypothetical protein